MKVFLLKRRGPWENFATAAAVVLAETEAHARVQACRRTEDDSFGSGKFVACDELPDGAIVVFPGGAAFPRR